MTWTSRILILVIFATFSWSVLSGTALASVADNITINRSNCQDCHNQQLGVSGVDTGRCASCHENHGNTQPSRFSGTGRHRETIHFEHSGVNNQAGCNSCHSPPACERCHSGHGNPQTKDCGVCHGVLPDPEGHNEETSVLQYGKHNWMKCNNCHQSDQFHFREFSFKFNESYKLCSVCHSKQANDERHYQGSNYSFCVNCHDPHSTGLKEYTRIEMPEIMLEVGDVHQTIERISGIFEDNFVMVLMVLIFIASVVAERAFKRKP